MLNAVLTKSILANGLGIDVGNFFPSPPSVSILSINAALIGVDTNQSLIKAP